MPGAVLYFLYLVVMVGGLVCFVQAFRHRFVTPLHKRWALSGTAVSLVGIAVVLLGAELLGWEVEMRFPEVVRVHRKIAVAATALLLLTAVTGALRIALHKRLYVVFLPVYVAALITAMVGYRP